MQIQYIFTMSYYYKCSIFVLCIIITTAKTINEIYFTLNVNVEYLLFCCIILNTVYFYSVLVLL